MASIVFAVTSIIYPYWGWYHYGSYELYARVIPGDLLVTGFILHSFAYLGFHRDHRSGVGMAAFVYSILSSIVFLSLLFLSWLGYHYSYAWMWIGYSVIGVAVILMGISLILDSRRMAEHSLLLTAGIIYLVSGTFITSFILSAWIPIGWVLLFVSAIICSVGLFESLREPGIPARRPLVPSYPMREAEAGPRFNFCPFCGARVDGANFCHSCGRRLSQ